MGSKYVTVAVTGFNSSPPPDDGSTSASNQGTWAGVKTKLADPLNTAIATINSELVTALDQSARSITANDSAVATDHDKIIQIASTTSPALTLTLSDAATMAAGYVVTINNQSSLYAATIARATGGDTIDGVAANVTLPIRSGIKFAVNAAGNGYLTTSRSNVDATGRTLVTSQATTSGTSFTFSSIPPWVTKIDILLAGISTNSTSAWVVRIGPSGGVETSSYTGCACIITSGAVGTSVNSTASFVTTGATVAAATYSGIVTLTKENASTNIWIMDGSIARGDGTATNHLSAGRKALAGVLTQLDFAAGGDTFDAGEINIQYS